MHGSADFYAFHDVVVKGVAHCTNMRKCIWTRDGALSSQLLEALHRSCPRLRELEVNGHSHVFYDPTLLVRFTGLTRISVIMPDRAFVSVLPRWIEATGASLRSLSLICKVCLLTLCCVCCVW